MQNRCAADLRNAVPSRFKARHFPRLSAGRLALPVLCLSPPCCACATLCRALQCRSDVMPCNAATPRNAMRCPRGAWECNAVPTRSRANPSRCSFIAKLRLRLALPGRSSRCKAPASRICALPKPFPATRCLRFASQSQAMPTRRLGLPSACSALPPPNFALPCLRFASPCRRFAFIADALLCCSSAARVLAFRCQSTSMLCRCAAKPGPAFA